MKVWIIAFTYYCKSSYIVILTIKVLHSGIIFLTFISLEVNPPSRWIVNFENDFVDGLVLASLVCAYAPYVVSCRISYFNRVIFLRSFYGK